MTVNCRVFQLAPYSDLQASSANHFLIKKYLLVIALIYFLLSLFLIYWMFFLFHSCSCSVVGSSVEQHHASVVVRHSAIHKTLLHFVLEQTYTFFFVIWQMGLLLGQLSWVAECHVSKNSACLFRPMSGVSWERQTRPNLVCLILAGSNGAC